MWNNLNGDTPTHYESSIDTSVSDSVESHWDTSHSISADIGVSVGPAEAKTSISYTTTWGRGGGSSQTVDVGTSDSISKVMSNWLIFQGNIGRPSFSPKRVGSRVRLAAQRGSDSSSGVDRLSDETDVRNGET
ncbi:MAG: hypothetical protein OXN93_08265 [bacterium]|nr:hypothetical protein [bacterium]